MTVDPVPSGMSLYEQRAWGDIERWRDKRLAARVRRQLPPAMRERIGTWGRRAKDGFESIPGAPDFERIFLGALEGLLGFGSRAATATVRQSAIISAYRKQGHAVDDLADIQKLDLSAIDKVTPHLGLSYTAAATLEGATAGFVVSGGTLLATMGSAAGAGAGAAPGAATVVGAMAADTAAVLLTAQRAIGHIAAYYGFDPDRPEEQIFSLGVLGMGTATEGGKIAAYAEINQLVQALARSAAWAQLNESVVTQVVRQVFARLGFRLTKEKLGQAVPVVGIALGAGLNARLLQHITDDAEHLYRERWLREKYGLALAPIDEDSYDSSERLNIAEIIDAELIEDEPQHSAAFDSASGQTGPNERPYEFVSLLERGSAELHEDFPDLVRAPVLIPTQNVIDPGDVDLFYSGLNSGLTTLLRGARFNTLDRPTPNGRWGLLSRSAEGGWYNAEYLSQIAAYVDAIVNLGYPAGRVFFELPASALQLDLAVLDDEGRVIILGEAKRDTDALETLRHGVLARFAESAPTTESKKRGDEPRQLAWRIWTVQPKITWLIGPGHRAAYETSLSPLRLQPLPSLPTAAELKLDHDPPTTLAPPKLV